MIISLDTSAYSAYFSGHKAIQQYIAHAAKIIIPCTVIGELYAAFYGGSRQEQNINGLKAFMLDPRVESLAKNHITAKVYGVYMAQLRKSRTPIPTNDVWIAAESNLAQAKLITLDNDFKYVSGLDVVILKLQK